MPDTVSDLACRLAENAEAVCRHYLSNGRRAGGYWLAGDVQNSPGRSLYVRLRGPRSGRGAAGKWTDAATGQHGDLLDLIGATLELRSMGDTLDEARRFLGLVRQTGPERLPPAQAGSLEAARRLFAMSKPIAGTLAEIYLRERGIVDSSEAAALRFHPHCFYRAEPASTDTADRRAEREAWPALIAAVTDDEGTLKGIQRTWLDPSGRVKAPVATPRRAMGHLIGHAVRFHGRGDGMSSATKLMPTRAAVMVAGEGIETVLSLRSILPAMPMAAALSAGHLASLLPLPGLRRLYVARDNDRAGQWAAVTLSSRMQEAGIEVLVLAPTLDDFNDDLQLFGPCALAAAVRVQLVPEDVSRFWRAPQQARGLPR